eukprot:2161885-Alexandrium_andersonii.AAC.1
MARELSAEERRRARSRSPPGEAEAAWLEEGRAGNYLDFEPNEPDWVLDADEDELRVTWLARTAADEVRPKKLAPEDQEKFRQSDKKEWDAVVGSGAVAVEPPARAALIRRRCPE